MERIAVRMMEDREFVLYKDGVFSIITNYFHPTRLSDRRAVTIGEAFIFYQRATERLLPFTATEDYEPPFLAELERFACSLDCDNVFKHSGYLP